MDEWLRGGADGVREPWLDDDPDMVERFDQA